MQSELARYQETSLHHLRIASLATRARPHFLSQLNIQHGLQSLFETIVQLIEEHSKVTSHNAFKSILKYAFKKSRISRNSEKRKRQRKRGTEFHQPPSPRTQDFPTRILDITYLQCPSLNRIPLLPILQLLSTPWEK